MPEAQQAPTTKTQPAKQPAKAFSVLENVAQPEIAIADLTLRQAVADPRSLPPRDVLKLQHTLGNRAVQRLLNKDTHSLQTKSAAARSGEAGFEAGNQVEEAIASQQHGGQPLPETVRRFMEPRFGADFGNVKVHADANSDQLNNSINARAFTTGEHIFFKDGNYAPESSSGRKLLAHELTHVVQQTGASPAGDSIHRASPAIQRASEFSNTVLNGYFEEIDWYSDKRYEYGFGLINQIKSHFLGPTILAKNNYSEILAGLNWVHAEMVAKGYGAVGNVIINDILRQLQAENGFDPLAVKGLMNELRKLIPLAGPVGRAHLDATLPLSVEQSQRQKKLLSSSGKGEEIKPLRSAVKPVELGKLNKALAKQAKAGLDLYNATRNNKIEVGDGSSYAEVLRLAIEKVLEKFGYEQAEARGESTDESASILVGRKDDIELHQADSRWEAVKTQPELVLSEAAIAAQYMVDTDPHVQGVLAAITKTHKPDSAASVEQAYLTAVMTFPGNAELFAALAEYRMRWAPLTVDSDIYIETAADVVDDFAAWTNYKYLVHEVVHTAAHPRFEKYVHEELPPDMTNLVLEGTVDFFAQEVWQAIVAEVEANPSDESVETVHGIRPAPTETASRELIAQLKQWAPRPLYTTQVPAIEAAVAGVTNGYARLKAAFFYGDVYHFFPAYKTPGASPAKKEAKEEKLPELPATTASAKPPSATPAVTGIAAPGPDVGAQIGALLDENHELTGTLGGHDTIMSQVRSDPRLGPRLLRLLQAFQTDIPRLVNAARHARSLDGLLGDFESRRLQPRV